MRNYVEAPYDSSQESEAHSVLSILFFYFVVVAMFFPVAGEELHSQARAPELVAGARRETPNETASIAAIRTDIFHSGLTRRLDMIARATVAVCREFPALCTVPSGNRFSAAGAAAGNLT